MTNKKRFLLITSICLLFLIGFVIMCYPLVASIYSDSVQSEIKTDYDNKITHTDKKELAEIRKRAEKFNAQLYRNQINRLDYKNNGYLDQLVTPDSNIMCYVRIPKIDVTLPVYHSVEDNALNNGAGHLPQSSLPIGGENCHSVISAHTGMAQSKMFTDLAILEPGDIFFIDVLGQTLTYKIMGEEDITVVLPSDINNIGIQDGCDYCTLVTCTPYGVNTHRLLVRGTRIETEDANRVAQADYNYQPIKHKSIWVQEYINSICNGIVIAFGLTLIGFIAVLLYQKHQRKIRRRNLKRRKMAKNGENGLDEITENRYNETRDNRRGGEKNAR